METNMEYRLDVGGVTNPRRLAAMLDSYLFRLMDDRSLGTMSTPFGNTHDTSFVLGLDSVQMVVRGVADDSALFDTVGAILNDCVSSGLVGVLPVDSHDPLHADYRWAVYPE